MTLFEVRDSLHAYQQGGGAFHVGSINITLSRVHNPCRAGKQLVNDKRGESNERDLIASANLFCTHPYSRFPCMRREVDVSPSNSGAGGFER